MCKSNWSECAMRCACSLSLVAFVPLGIRAAEPDVSAADSNADRSRQARIVRALIELASAGGGYLLDAQPRDWPDAHVARWLADHSQSVLRVNGSPFDSPPPWGRATQRENMLYLHVFNWPTSRSVKIPRLHNSVRRIYLLGNPNRQEQKLSPGVAKWAVELPDSQPGTLVPVLAMELDAPPRAATSRPPKVAPAANGDILLHARNALTHGSMLRFEPQPHKNTIGYWTRPEDWIEWSFSAEAPGSYQVVLRYGCGVGQGGSRVLVGVGSEEIAFDVTATGGFQSWREVSLGTVTPAPGEDIRLTIRAQQKAKNAVMDVQQIVLRTLSGD